MPIRLHNVLMGPGLEISGCAEPALVASEPVISVPSSPGKVDEEDVPPGKEEPSHTRKGPRSI